MICPKCKSLMYPKDGKFVCKKCGYERTSEEKTVKIKREDKDIAFLEGEGKDVLPKTRVECPKCGNKEAYWILRQTRASDEPETRFYICTKCNHRWRE